MVAGAFGISICSCSSAWVSPGLLAGARGAVPVRRVRRRHDRGREHDHADADARRGPEPDERRLRGGAVDRPGGRVPDGGAGPRRGLAPGGLPDRGGGSVSSRPCGCCRCARSTHRRGGAPATAPGGPRPRPSPTGAATTVEPAVPGSIVSFTSAEALEAESAPLDRPPIATLGPPASRRAVLNAVHIEPPFRTRLPGMATAYDAIVVGGGHNGLIAAAYLAKKGARTVVLEARHKTGGAADTMRPWPEAPEHQGHDAQLRDEPDARHDPAGPRAGRPRLPHGPDGPVLRARSPTGGTSSSTTTTRRANYDEFAKFSKRDADAIEQWDAWIGGLADVLGPLLMTTPPRLGSTSMRDLTEQLRLAWRFRGLQVQGVADVTRLMTMSIVDILDRFFESDQVKTVMALNGLIGTWAGPHEPGTGYVMAHHSIGDVGRRPRRRVGDGDRRDGRGVRGPRVERAVVRRRDPDRGAGRPDPHRGRRRPRRRARRRRGAARRRSSSRRPTPQITFLRQLEASELPSSGSSTTSGTGARASGTVKINLALDRAPVFSSKPDRPT